MIDVKFNVNFPDKLTPNRKEIMIGVPRDFFFSKKFQLNFSSTNTRTDLNYNLRQTFAIHASVGPPPTILEFSASRLPTSCLSAFRMAQLHRLWNSWYCALASPSFRRMRNSSSRLSTRDFRQSHKLRSTPSKAKILAKQRCATQKFSTGRALLLLIFRRRRAQVFTCAPPTITHRRRRGLTARRRIPLYASSGVHARPLLPGRTLGHRKG